MGRTFASLKYHNYRIWFFTALVANVGTWMQRVTQDWVVLTHLTNNNGFAIGVVTALQFAPILVLGAYAGVLADRYDRRRILVFTKGSSVILGLILGLLMLFDIATLWHMYVLALCIGIVSAFDSPPRQVFVSSLVPQKALSNAVGLNSMSFNIARLIGPAVAGLLIHEIGAGWVFILSSAFFSSTVLGLLLMHSNEFYHSEKRAKRGQRGQIREAIRYVTSREDLRVIFTVAGVVSCLGMNFQLTTAIMARTVFDKGSQEYGILGSVLAIGSLMGAIMAARRTQARTRTVVFASLAFGVTAGINSLMPTYLLYAVSLIPIGFCMLTLLTTANTTVQMTTDPVIRGRVMALYQMVMMGLTLVGAPTVGWVSQHIHPRMGVGIGAISAFSVGIWALFWVRKHWKVEARLEMKPTPHVEFVGPTERRNAALAQEARRAREAGEAAEDAARNQVIERTPGDQPK